MKKLLKLFNRKGNCILETVLTLPAFIISVVMLISIIPAIADFEESVFVSCDALRMEAVTGSLGKAPVAAVMATKNMKDVSHTVTDYHVTGFKTGERINGIDDVSELRYKSVFKKRNPLGAFSRISFEGRIQARQFTGTVNKGTPTPREEFEKGVRSKKVYVFPQSGKKYHNARCSHINPECKMRVLTKEMKKRCSSCKTCDSKELEVGDTVFYFKKSGTYHRGSCPAVKKYYVEMELEDAKKKGYTPCRTCGG